MPRPSTGLGSFIARRHDLEGDVKRATERIQPITQPDEGMALAWLRNHALRHGIQPTGLYLDALRTGDSIQIVLMDREEGSILRLKPGDEPELHQVVARLLCQRSQAMTLGVAGVRYDQGLSEAVGAP